MKENTTRVLILTEVIVNNDVSKISNYNGIFSPSYLFDGKDTQDFIEFIKSQIETPLETAFTGKMIDHLKEYGYSITAEVLPRDKAKVIDLLLPDSEKTKSK